MRSHQQTRPRAPERAPRLLASITGTRTREDGFLFCHLLERDEECFLHQSAVPRALWNALKVGDAITCRVAQTRKGLRGYAVARGTDDDQDHVWVKDDNRGNC